MDYINKIPHWLRWILALPTAVLAAWLGSGIAIIVYQMWNGIDPSKSDFWSHIIWTVAETGIFVVVFYTIVPTYKFLSSIIVNSLIGGLALFSMIYAILNGTINGSVWDIVINDLILIGILIYYSSMLYKDEAKASISPEPSSVYDDREH
ncbi:MAG TPA: hypothetical protein DCZ10_17785 [Pelotomaculum sp.]|nr:hypothetical protein [Pelotomaculum sp.]